MTRGHVLRHTRNRHFRAPWGGVALAMVWLLGLLPGSSDAQILALLVGVSGYPSLAPNLRLQGPRNDLPLLRQALLARGVPADRVTMLADQLPGAGLPTRANILGAIDALQSAAHPGDVVIVYFAGHGSREPADLSEGNAAAAPAGGWHATILPLDVGRWDGQQRRVDNAIRDVELRSRLDLITRKGAFVWAIFDTCHSAGLVRGSQHSDATGNYSVEPSDLGVPAAALLDAGRGAEPTRGRDAAQSPPQPRAHDLPAADTSGAAFFYAAQAGEVTAELSLPEDDAQAQRHGVFSFALTRALATGRPMTYRQLSQMILTQYATLHARTTPPFTGGGLDTPVLGQTAPACNSGR